MAKFIVGFLLLFGGLLADASSEENAAARVSELIHVGSCQLDQVPADRVGRSTGAISGWFEAGSSQRRSFSIEIQIFADSTYWAHYQEFVAPTELGGAEWSEESLKQIIEGKWQTVGDKLNLIGLGQVTILTDQAGVVQPKFTLGTQLVSESAVGLTANLHVARTYMGPKHLCDMRAL